MDYITALLLHGDRQDLIPCARQSSVVLLTLHCRLKLVSASILLSNGIKEGWNPLSAALTKHQQKLGTLVLPVAANEPLSIPESPPLPLLLLPHHALRSPRRLSYLQPNTHPFQRQVSPFLLRCRASMRPFLHQGQLETWACLRSAHDRDHVRPGPHGSPGLCPGLHDHHLQDSPKNHTKRGSLHVEDAMRVTDRKTKRQKDHVVWVRPRSGNATGHVNARHVQEREQSANVPLHVTSDSPKQLGLLLGIGFAETATVIHIQHGDQAAASAHLTVGACTQASNLCFVLHLQHSVYQV